MSVSGNGAFGDMRYRADDILAHSPIDFTEKTPSSEIPGGGLNLTEELGFTGTGLCERGRRPERQIRRHRRVIPAKWQEVFLFT